MAPWPRLVYCAALYALSPLIIARVWREQVPTCVTTGPRRQRLGLGAEVHEPALWLHCASMGEVRAARPLIEALLGRYPGHRLLVTTMTATGAEQVQALANRLAAEPAARLEHRFVPLDWPGSARRFVTRVRPVLAVMFETELWPNLLHACRRAGVPVAVVNGRLSPRAFARYRRIKPLMRQALGNVAWLAAKSAADAERFAALGMAPERTDVVGSLKFEVAPEKQTLEVGERLRTELEKDGGERPIWVAGSTRDGEEAALLEAHKTLRTRYPDALLVLVPRHPQRFDAVADDCRAGGFALARRSRGESVTRETAVYLGDTLGELGALYAAGDLAFVGGSLVPLGGQNVVEPASLGRPVLTGPSLDNFDDVAEPLKAAGALATVADADALAEALVGAFDDPPRTRARGRAGKAVVAEQRGALERTLDGLGRLLTPIHQRGG
ncbi:lipid IV(A) 3-deoxy-D-manno-octulosonic acid transferase [Halomonas garicola]|uniref:lipid IV(A) 3-deoxy-D-manno-octulosonic acid transferase n=1 Tax=Halomonas garicola TaxID=1690008 RepID=UPI00289AD586|nr:lipid IV(A) 3-deoxy-D-manno-octulosonic acid transferase [Halomonas garicola]